MNKKILIGSHNPGKIREIIAILTDIKGEIISPVAINLKLTVNETGGSYEENARLKALAYLTSASMPALADDSGLEVDALDGAPGIYSARYSNKKKASDADRCQFLLDQLKEKAQPWTARFTCTAALALSADEIYITNGVCEGVIISEKRGSGGFGYDPIFYLPEYQATMAELPESLKNKVSHRAKALAGMIPIINHYAAGP